MAVKVSIRKFIDGPREGEQIVAVESPYSAEFVAGARKLNGTFNRQKSRWEFSPLVIDKVHDLCLRVYGEDGREAPTPADLVTLRVTFDEAWRADKQSIEIGGRIVARAFGRDSGAKLGDDVILTQGRVTSGGSVKNWLTVAAQGTVAEILNMPRRKAEQIVAEGESGCTFEIVEQAALPVPIAPQPSRDELLAERERLIVRIAEIDAVLEPQNA